MKPATSVHEGILVVRDDLFPGGTKARFIGSLFGNAEELVYASPCEGGAQTAIATVAKAMGRRATIFVAQRAKPHPRSLMAKSLGAKVLQVRPGYLNVVRARATAYAGNTGAKLLPFGIDTPEAETAISAAARSLDIHPTEVWCASGSGVLARALAKAWPNACRKVVQVGRTLLSADVGGAEILTAPQRFEDACKVIPPFPSDPHYDAKAWAICKARRSRTGLVVFWNVTGPARPLEAG